MLELMSVVSAKFAADSLLAMLGGLLSLLSGAWGWLFPGGDSFFRPRGKLWSERVMKATTDWVSRGGSDGGKLVRTIPATFVIAIFGILFYGEDSLRNLGMFPATGG